MAEVKVTTRAARNQYTAPDDVIEKLDDGRQRLVVRKGTTMPREQAVQLGLVKESAPAGPAETKVSTPGAETKTKPGDGKSGDKK
jgi:hypothetical protein